MADKTLQDLTEVTTTNGTDFLHVSQGTGSDRDKKVSRDNLLGDTALKNDAPGATAENSRTKEAVKAYSIEEIYANTSDLTNSKSSIDGSRVKSPVSFPSTAGWYKVARVQNNVAMHFAICWANIDTLPDKGGFEHTHIKVCSANDGSLEWIRIGEVGLTPSSTRIQKARMTSPSGESYRFLEVYINPVAGSNYQLFTQVIYGGNVYGYNGDHEPLDSPLDPHGTETVDLEMSQEYPVRELVVGNVNGYTTAYYVNPEGQFIAPSQYLNYTTIGGGGWSAGTNVTLNAMDKAQAQSNKTAHLKMAFTTSAALSAGDTIATNPANVFNLANGDIYTAGIHEVSGGNYSITISWNGSITSMTLRSGSLPSGASSANRFRITYVIPVI